MPFDGDPEDGDDGWVHFRLPADVKAGRVCTIQLGRGLQVVFCATAPIAAGTACAVNVKSALFMIYYGVVPEVHKLKVVRS